MKKITSLFAVTGLALFALTATLSSQAQTSITNFISFKLTAQYAGDDSSSGVITTVPLGSLKISNKEILSFLASDYNAAGLYPSTNFPTGAKLAIIDGYFYVLAADNSPILSVSDTLWMDDSAEGVEYGKFNDVTKLSAPSSTELYRIKFAFDDTSIVGGNDLSFQMWGLARSSYNDSTPDSNTGVYSETQKHTVTSIVGDGHKDGGIFVITGTATASGKASLMLPP